LSPGNCISRRPANSALQSEVILLVEHLSENLKSSEQQLASTLRVIIAPFAHHPLSHPSNLVKSSENQEQSSPAVNHSSSDQSRALLSKKKSVSSIPVESSLIGLISSIGLIKITSVSHRQISRKKSTLSWNLRSATSSLQKLPKISHSPSISKIARHQSVASQSPLLPSSNRMPIRGTSRSPLVLSNRQIIKSEPSRSQSLGPHLSQSISLKPIKSTSNQSPNPKSSNHSHHLDQISLDRIKCISSHQIAPTAARNHQLSSSKSSIKVPVFIKSQHSGTPPHSKSRGITLALNLVV